MKTIDKSSIANQVFEVVESSDFYLPIGEKLVLEYLDKGANIIQGVYNLYDGRGKGSTLATAENTAWGLLNAVAEHVDHHSGRNDNNRLRGAWFGTGEDLKNNALQVLLKAA